MSDAKIYSAGHPSPIELPRVILKLRNSTLKDEPNDIKLIFSLLDRALPGSSDGARVKRLFIDEAPGRLDELVKRAACLDPTYEPVNLNAWYQVLLHSSEVEELSFAQQLGPSTSPYVSKSLDFRSRELVYQLVFSLEQLSEIESVSATRRAPPPGPNDPTTTAIDHGYLNSAPEGLDFKSAWSYPPTPTAVRAPRANQGAGIKLIDVEAGWNLHHEDLPPSAPGTVISGGYSTTDIAEVNHGTQVMGILFMIPDNNLGWDGLAPAGTGYGSRILFPDPDHQNGRVVFASVESGLLNAIQSGRLGFGDVILIECQIEHQDRENQSQVYVPAECNPAVFEMIRLATALGIIVIEAAGNYGKDLDNLGDPTPEQGLRLNRRPEFSAYFKDSGAILVGACNPKDRTPWETSDQEFKTNYGSRVDVFAWGNFVYTTLGDEVDSYTPDFQTFDGTSAASAIIAGAVMVLQGISQSTQNCRYSPFEMRNLLVRGGVATNSAGTEAIGVMPDLNRLSDVVGGQQQPDLYIRKNATDNGTIPFPGPDLSSSPDIIIRENEGFIDDCQAFTPGGQDHYIYVKVNNRSLRATTATIHVDVYWAETSTLCDWKDAAGVNHHIGRLTISDSIAARGAGAHATTGLPWGSSASPNKQYSFLAIVSSDEDPAPQIPDFREIRKSIARKLVLAKGFRPKDDVALEAAIVANHLESNVSDEVLQHYNDFLQKNNNLAVRNVMQTQFFRLPGSRPTPTTLQPFNWGNSPYGQGFKTGASFESYGRLPPFSQVCVRMPMILARQLNLKLRMEWIKGCDACGISDDTQNENKSQQFRVHKTSAPTNIESPTAEEVQCEHDKTGGFVEYPLRAQGRFLIAEGQLDAGAVYACQLVVNVPDPLALDSDIDYAYSIRQLLGGKEMGRITWEIKVAPEKRVESPGRLVEHAAGLLPGLLRWMWQKLVAAFGFGRNG